jgi:hypothetical protein
MKTRPSRQASEGGAAAVELALILPILISMLLFSLLLGRFLWHYTAAQKAAQDGARYLSTISEQEMREQTLAAEAVELNSGAAPTIIIECGNDPCVGVRNLPLPDTVSVSVRMGFFDLLGLIDTGRYGIPIDATAEMRYVGN